MVGRKKTRELKICLYCGKEHEVHQYRIKKGLGKYCSYSCSTKANYSIIAVNIKRQYGEKHHNWVGRIVTHCEMCGKAMTVRPYILKLGWGKYCSLSCRAKSNIKKGKLRRHGFIRKPTKPEIALSNLVAKDNLPFKYVGEGEVWLGNHNPDFINTNGKKQVIELFGTYWHPVFDVAQRIEHYKQYGFDCLIIWEDELKKPEAVLKKVHKFARRRQLLTGVEI